MAAFGPFWAVRSSGAFDSSMPSKVDAPLVEIAWISMERAGTIISEASFKEKRSEWRRKQSLWLEKEIPGW